MNTRHVLIGLLLAAASTIARAQVAAPTEERHASLVLMARADRDSIVLRWAPNKAGGWAIANRFGYHVERVAVNADGSFDRKAYERLTRAPIFPWTLDQWKANADRANAFAAVAAQALYGRAFVPSGTQGDVSVLRNAATEFSNRYSFSLLAADVDAVAGTGLALRTVDRNVNAGQTYIYRVSVAGIDPTYLIDTAYVVATADRATSVPAPSGVTAEGGENVVELRWDEPLMGGYSGFYVERSDNNGRTFRRLTPTPLIAMVPDQAHGKAPTPKYTDTTVVNYKPYVYRVMGITPFAELSPPATIRSYGRDRTPPDAPVVAEPMPISGGRVRVTWKVPKEAPDLAGFVVARSASSISSYRELTKTPLPKSSREYIDATATEAEPYYIVGAVDTAGNVAPALAVYATFIDSIPPAPPSGVRGTIDTNGIVRLTWNLGPEPDLYGYRVLFANDQRHEFTQLTGFPLRDTVFTDSITLRSLTKDIFYEVVALDKRYNHSIPSAPIRLRKPDRVPPEASVFTGVSVTDSSVVLKWERSRSLDVASQILYRKSKSDSAWASLVTLPSTASQYVDRKVRSGTTYDYAIEAVDSSGLRSARAMSVRARPYDSGVRPGVAVLRVEYDQKKGVATVRWTYQAKIAERHWFVVYRSLGNALPRQYRAVDSSARTFEDSALPQKGVYSYRVQVMTSMGAESLLSEPVSIVVP